MFHRVLLTHALALSASQLVHKKKSQRIYTSMHSAGLELTKLTYTRLEDNLIRHRGDRLIVAWVVNRFDTVSLSLPLFFVLRSITSVVCALLGHPVAKPI